MKITIAENIKALRKGRKMTQEQLAEAMGVTVGAVHKWESRASMPEIRLVMELADLFGVSVDMLLGYEMKNSSAEDIIERINGYLRAKDYDSALAEADKARTRYPNTFIVVDCCADAYERKGIETGDPEAIMRAIRLMERSIPLLSQNTDPRISEVTVRSEIATCYIALKEYDKGIELLKKYNAGGMNNSMLAIACTQMEPFDRKGAEEYLPRTLSDFVTQAIRGMSGYVNYYVHMKDFASALEASEWLVQFLQSLKADSSAVCYPDKIIAVFQAVSAGCMLVLGREAEAQDRLLEAYRRAVAFDAAPVYGADSIRFMIGDTTKGTSSDDLGETAMSAVEKLLRSDSHGLPALELWEKIKAEHSAEIKEETIHE